MSAAVVRRYYLYRATGAVGFIWPIFTLFLLFRGLSFTEIAVLSTVSATLVVSAEIPTGYVGDRLGRRDSMLASTVLTTASLAGFVVAESFPAFLVLYALWAVGLAFASGSQDAWLYDTLAANGTADTFTHISGRAGSVGQWSMAVTMIAGGLLYVHDPRLPFVASVAAGVAAATILLSLPRNPEYEGDGDRLAVADVAPILRRLTDPPLRSFVLAVGMFFAVVRAADSYIQPVTVTVLRSNIDLAGFPEEATLGVLYASFAVVAAVASYHAGTLEARFGVRQTVLLVPGVTAAVLVAPVLVPLIALPAFLAMKAADAAMKPIVAGYLNDRIESAGRATVLSAASMAYALVRAPLVLAGGVIADVTSPRFAVAALGGALLVGGLMVWRWETPVATTARQSAAR